ncbi:hypothetical protein C3L33_10686, partial [Rhododendron williamsianum]
MLRSSFGDWEAAAMCFRNDSHRLVYKPSRSFVRKYAETLAIDDGLQDSAVEVVPWLNKMIYASFIFSKSMMKLAGSLKILKPILMLSLCENTKSVLIAASYILLKHREQVKYTSEFPTVNPKILLSGPAGSEIYQEMLTKALAKYFGAKLLIFDSHSFLGERGVDTADMISFLLELSFHVTGEAYNMNTLTDFQRNVIKDLADLGLVKLQQGRKESWFIPTKLATNLSISLSDLSSRKQFSCKGNAWETKVPLIAASKALRILRKRSRWIQ